MTLFTNSNFIHHIVQSQGVEHHFKKQHYPLLQTLLQLETRQLLQTALKFMRKDRRNHLTTDDLELALRELNHQQLVITPSGTHIARDQYVVKEDQLFTSPAAIMEQQLKLVGNRQLEGPKLSGRWIYLRGKVPATTENLNIKKLQQLKQSGKHSYEQQRKLCNIIKDDPYSFLNAEQSTYFIHVSKIIKADAAPNGFNVQGNLNNLMPFLLKLIAQNQLNETSITYFIKLLSNKYIWKSIEFYASRAFQILLAYKGPQSFDVGMKIAQMVKTLSRKYPNLNDIYVKYEDQSYSTILKKIAFELYVGVPFIISRVTFEKIRLQADNNDEMAILCIQKLLEHSSHLLFFRELLTEMKTYLYWHPCDDMEDDLFMRMY